MQLIDSIILLLMYYKPFLNTVFLFFLIHRFGEYNTMEMVQKLYRLAMTKKSIFMTAPLKCFLKSFWADFEENLCSLISLSMYFDFFKYQENILILTLNSIIH